MNNQNTQITAPQDNRFWTGKVSDEVEVTYCTNETMRIDFDSKSQRSSVTFPIYESVKVSELRKLAKKKGLKGMAVNKVINAYWTHPIRNVVFDAEVSKVRNDSTLAFSHVERTATGITKIVAMPILKEGKAKAPKAVKPKLPSLTLTLLPSGTQWKGSDGEVYGASDLATLQALHTVTFA